MSSNGLPPNLAAWLYIAAGALFVADAFASGRIAFSGVGLAFVVLGAVILLRQRKGQ